MKIKFVHLNVWGNGVIFNKAVNFLVKQRADIVNLQEVYDGHNPKLSPGFRGLDIFRKRLGLGYFFYAPTVNVKREGVWVLEGTAIFSRWPIICSATGFYGKPYDNRYPGGFKNLPNKPRALQQATVDLGKNKQLNVFNTHGVWGLNGQDNPNRLRMSRFIVSQIKGQKKVILSGDFNVNEGTKSIKNIDRHLVNVFKGERQSSFNMKRKPVDSGYKNAVVDFVFTSKDIKVLKHQMPEVDVSDHYPLVCVFDV